MRVACLYSYVTQRCYKQVSAVTIVQVSSQLEQWAEELQHAELSAELSKAEQLLVLHVDSVQHMQATVSEMLQQGQKLVQVLKKYILQCLFTG